MKVIQKLKVKNLNGTFEQTVPIGARSKYIYRDDDDFSTNQPLETDLRLIENNIERLDGPKEVTNSVYYKIEELEDRLHSNKDIDFTNFQLVTDEFDKLNGGPEVTDSISNKIVVETLMDKEDNYNNFLNIGNGFRAILNDAPDANKSELYNNFEEVGNELRLIQGDIDTEGSVAYQIDQLYKTVLNEETTYQTLKSIGDRLRFLEGSDTGSIKNQIATAKSEILNGAEADYDTLKDIQNLFEKLKTDEKETFDTLGEIAAGIEANASDILNVNTNIAETNSNLEKTKLQLQADDDSIREKVAELQGTILPGETLEYGNIVSINNILTSLTGEQSNPLVPSIDERINTSVDAAIDGLVGESKEELNTLEKLGNSLTDLKTKVDNENNLATYSVDFSLAEGIECNLARYGYLISLNISAFGAGFETGIELLKTLQINLLDHLPNMDFLLDTNTFRPYIKKLIPLNNTDACVMIAQDGLIHFTEFQIAENSQQLFYGISEIFTIQPVDEIIS